MAPLISFLLDFVIYMLMSFLFFYSESLLNLFRQNSKMPGLTRRTASTKACNNCKEDKQERARTESDKPTRKPSVQRKPRTNFIRKNIAAASYYKRTYSASGDSSTMAETESETTISVCSSESSATTSESASSDESESTLSTISSRTANYTLAKYLQCYDKIYKQQDLKRLNHYEYKPRTARRPSISSLIQRGNYHLPPLSTVQENIRNVPNNFHMEKGMRGSDNHLPPILTKTKHVPLNQKIEGNPIKKKESNLKLPDIHANNMTLITKGNVINKTRGYRVLEKTKLKIKSDTHIKAGFRNPASKPLRYWVP